MSTLSVTITNLGCALNVTDVIAIKLPNLVAATGPVLLRLQNASFPILKMKGVWDNSSNTLSMTFLGMYKYYRNHTRTVISKLQTKQNLPTGTKFTVFVNTTSVSPTNLVKSARFTATNMAMIQNDPRWVNIVTSFSHHRISYHCHIIIVSSSYFSIIIIIIIIITFVIIIIIHPLLHTSNPPPPLSSTPSHHPPHPISPHPISPPLSPPTLSTPTLRLQIHRANSIHNLLYGSNSRSHRPPLSDRRD